MASKALSPSFAWSDFCASLAETGQSSGIRKNDFVVGVHF